MINEREARELLVEYGKKLLECGLVQGTWGNISVRLDEKFMLVTPSGLDYERLGADDMVKVEIETLNHEGNHKPTTEKGIHAAVYKNRPEIGAVIHTHSKYCCMFAAAHQDMPIEDEELQKTFGTVVKTGKYGRHGSEKLVKNTIEALGNNYACIMANHGMVACGADMDTAFENCKKIEKCGEKYIEEQMEGMED